MGTKPRVLILLLGAIGDVVRGLAVAVEIRKQWPDARITWAVETVSKSLVEQHPAIDRVVEFKRAEKLSGYVAFVRELRREPYDICLDLQRHFKSGLSARLSGAIRRIGFDRKNSREGNWLFQTQLIAPQERDSPKIEQFFAFLESIELPRPELAEFGLAPTEVQRAKIAALLPEQSEVRGRVAFLIGSTWESRIWELEYYAELSKLLWDRWQLQVVLLGGPGDRQRAEQISEHLDAAISVMNLVGKTSLRDLVAVFERCSIAVGSDSGPMHIAAACGLPIVSLWGATSPRRSGPYGSERYVLQSAVGCAPCYRKDCPGLDRLCMRALTPEVVYAQLQRVFDEQKVLK